MNIKIAVSIFFFFIIFSCKKEEKTAQNIPPQNVSVIKVITKSVPVYREFVGQVYGEKDIPIRARVDGYLEKIHFDEGSHVRSGQLLYTVDSKPFEENVAAMKSAVSEAETMLAQKESDLKRIIPLAEMDAVSKRELDMAQAQRDAAVSALEAAKANLNISEINLGYTSIESPIDGIIGKTNAREGEYVGRSPNPVILNTVSQIQTVLVQFFLAEKEYLTIARRYLGSTDSERKKRRNNPNLELILADGSIHKFKGHVDFIDRNVDPSTGAILVQASFPNPNELIRPGQYTKVKALFENQNDAILIPQKVVREIQGEYYVYLINESNMVENRHVEISRNFEDYFVIKEGLKAGDIIVLDNLQKLRPDMTIIPNEVEYQSRTSSENQ